jgi:uncharacterized phage protein (TIGR01671 family)
VREIEFRGKLKNSVDSQTPAGAWVYGGHSFWRGGACIHEKDSAIGLFVDPETVGQYAGVKDRNGRKIFEGDVVEIKFDNTDDPRLATFLGELRRGVVEYRKGGFGAKTINLSDDNYKFEVIGNKSDNPELLKGVSQ